MGEEYGRGGGGMVLGPCSRDNMLVRSAVLNRVRENVRFAARAELIQCGPLTPSRFSPSSLWRGMTVTISISHRKAVSGGVNPEGNGRAMVCLLCEDPLGQSKWMYSLFSAKRGTRPGVNGRLHQL